MKSILLFVWFIILSTVILSITLVGLCYFMYPCVSFSYILKVAKEFEIMFNILMYLSLLIITFNISRLVEKNEQNRHFNHFRYQVYKELCDIFIDVTYDDNSYKRMKANVCLFLAHNGFLFVEKEILKKLIESLIESIDSAIKVLEQVKKENRGQVYLGVIDDSFFDDLIEKLGVTDEAKYSTNLKEFYSRKDALLTFVQNEIFPSSVKYYLFQNIKKRVCSAFCK